MHVQYCAAAYWLKALSKMISGIIDVSLEVTVSIMIDWMKIKYVLIDD